jgi:hypothetical protein
LGERKLKEGTTSDSRLWAGVQHMSLSYSGMPIEIGYGNTKEETMIALVQDCMSKRQENKKRTEEGETGNEASLKNKRRNQLSSDQRELILIAIILRNGVDELLFIFAF